MSVRTVRDKSMVGMIADAVINDKDLSFLQDMIADESILAKVADRIKKEEAYGALYRLVGGFWNYRSYYDWNASSILQYFDLYLVMEAIHQFSDRRPIYESIGLASILGEYRRRNDPVVSHLRAVVAEAKNPKAWWRAAQSLEMIGVDDAVSLLKRSVRFSALRDLDWCLDNLHDYRAMINVLVLCDRKDTGQLIFRKAREILLKSRDVQATIGAAWLLARLRMIDDEIVARIADLARDENSELVFYAFFAVQDLGDSRFCGLLEYALGNKDQLIRRMAVRGLACIGLPDSIPAIRSAMLREQDKETMSEMCRALSGLRHPSENNAFLSAQTACYGENGLLARYGKVPNEEGAVASVFHEAVDPDGLCLDAVRGRLSRRHLSDPVILPAENWKGIAKTVNRLNCSGSVFCLEPDREKAKLIRRHLGQGNPCGSSVEVFRDAGELLSARPDFRARLIIRPFSLADILRDRILDEDGLGEVVRLMSDDGLFVTVGFDETYNDDISRLTYDHAVGSPLPKDFDAWRQAKVSAKTSPLNCRLRWFRRGMAVPVRFTCQREAVDAIGKLFGRDAAKRLISQWRTHLEIMVGITCSTRKDMERAVSAKGD